MRLDQATLLHVIILLVAINLFNRDKHQERRDEEIRKTEEFNKRRKEANFEKGDTWALIIAALTTILPIALFIILVVWFLTSAVFRFFS